jgi:hypothetical protein
VSTKNEPKFEFRAPKAGEWYLAGDSMAVPTYAVMTLDTEQWVIVKPGPEPAPWPGPEQEVIVITGISDGEPPQHRLALRNSLGVYLDDDGRRWYKDDREYGAQHITSWEPYQPTPERREYTADDLDNLPKGTCAWDEDGEVWQRRTASWALAGGRTFHNPLRGGVVEHLYSAPPEED